MTARSGVCSLGRARRGRRVPRTDVKQPKGLPPISTLKVLYDFDVVKAAASRDAYLKKFDEIFSKKN